MRAAIAEERAALAAIDVQRLTVLADERQALLASWRNAAASLHAFRGEDGGERWAEEQLREDLARARTAELGDRDRIAGRVQALRAVEHLLAEQTPETQDNVVMLSRVPE
ncbi:MAG: hypothetical protein ACOC3D_06205 [Pseudomonadota bacterium]